MTVAADAAEELRASFIELAPDGFEEADLAGEVELAAYGAAAERVRGAFPDALVTEVEEGWEDRWREFHHGVVVGDIWIGPPWEAAPDGLPAVVIDPGRAFGTGAHPTTKLCLELLRELPHGSLLDIGCGSGVLAIAAARLGFAPITAVDSDEVAVEVARENAGRNGVEIEVRVLDALVGELPAAAAAVANIAPDVVSRLVLPPSFLQVVTSGYFAVDLPLLEGFEPAVRRTLDGWAADLHVREPSFSAASE